jgi:hypothetical protein
MSSTGGFARMQKEHRQILLSGTAMLRQHEAAALFNPPAQ